MNQSNQSPDSYSQACHVCGNTITERGDHHDDCPNHPWTPTVTGEGRAYRAGYEAGTSAAKQTSDRPERRDDFGRVANKIRAALEEELRGASPEYLTGFNRGMHDVWFESLQEDPPEGVTARATPLEDREAGVCRFCGQRVIDGAPEAGGDQSRPYWMTDPRHAADGIGGDYGCDPSPETHPDEGVGAHAVTEEEVRRAEEWAIQQFEAREGVTARATPRPWSRRVVGRQDCFLLEGSNGEVVHKINVENEQAEANAALIVRAVNAHDELVDLLAEALDGFWHYVEQANEEPEVREIVDDFAARARAALAKARGDR